MKKMFLLLATGFALLATQSCSKCGHCHKETTYPNFGGGTTTDKTDDNIICGSTTDKEATLTIAKAAELNCKAWAGQQTPQTGVTYTSSWQTDK